MLLQTSHKAHCDSTVPRPVLAPAEGTIHAGLGKLCTEQRRGEMEQGEGVKRSEGWWREGGWTGLETKLAHAVSYPPSRSWSDWMDQLDFLLLVRQYSVLQEGTRGIITLHNSTLCWVLKYYFVIKVSEMFSGFFLMAHLDYVVWMVSMNHDKIAVMQIFLSAVHLPAKGWQMHMSLCAWEHCLKLL